MLTKDIVVLHDSDPPALRRENAIKIAAYLKHERREAEIREAVSEASMRQHPWLRPEDFL